MWPTISTVRDVEDVWPVLPMVAENLTRCAEEDQRIPSRFTDPFLRELEEVSVRHRHRDLASVRRDVDELILLPTTSEPVLDPIAPESGDVVGTASAFWCNRYGLTALRVERRAGVKSARARVRTLGPHVDDVLLPALSAEWARLGDRYADAIATHEVAVTEASSWATATPSPTPPVVKGPSWH